jgi:aryl-alcohol dehydrogenase-like predicted oxidoreductase
MAFVFIMPILAASDPGAQSFSPSTPMSRFALGTAQLGMPYGVANTVGMPSETEAVALIRAAIAAGVTTIDTARAYGDAELRIGLALAGFDTRAITVVTKLDPLAGVGPEDTEIALRATEESLNASRRALHRDNLDVLLLHRAAHRIQWNGAVWRKLRDERNAGRIGRLGVSVGTPEEALSALADADVAHIQLPYNVLDRRWERAGVIHAARARPDVVVHVRSVYLQGLLARADAPWPQVAGVEPAAIKHILAALVSRCGRDDFADLCLAYVRAQDWIDGIVIGIETIAQLAANLALFDKPILDDAACALIRDTIPVLPETLLDPARWSHPST